jgi:hypothetical protein
MITDDLQSEGWLRVLSRPLAEGEHEDEDDFSVFVRECAVAMWGNKVLSFNPFPSLPSDLPVRKVTSQTGKRASQARISALMIDGIP